MARFPFLNADGTFQSAQVKTQLDARTDARMRDQLPTLAEELGIGGIGVPIFETLAEAQEWEAAHPGETALTIENVTPDTTAPTWSATFTVGTPTDKDVVVTASALATDDRAVTGYEVTYNGSAGSPTWTAITPSGKNFTLSGTANTTYASTKLRAKDAAGNVSAPLSVPSYTMGKVVASAATYDAAINALAPIHYLPLEDPAGTTTLARTGSGSGSFTQSVAGFTLGGVDAGLFGGVPVADASGAGKFDGPTNPLGGKTNASALMLIKRKNTGAAWSANPLFVHSTGFVFTAASGSIGATVNGTSANYILTSSTAWALVGFTYDGTTVRVYRNGVEVATATPSTAGAIGATASLVSINGGQYSLSRIAMFGSTLTPAQMLDLAQKAGVA